MLLSILTLLFYDSACMIFLLSWVLRQVRQRLKADVAQMKLQDPNFSPGLVVLQVRARWDDDRPLEILGIFGFWLFLCCFVLLCAAAWKQSL